MNVLKDFDGIRISEANGVATVVLARPDAYNTLTLELISEITDCLKKIDSSNSTRVIILAAEGKAFSTGHDLKEIKKKNNKPFLNELFTKCSNMMMLIRQMRQPVIAQVQGIATAAGCQLVASCDLVIASEDAKFATNGINNGLYCATPSVAVSRAIKPKHALEMLLLGDFIDATRAAELGLVNRVAPTGLLQKETQTLAKQLVSKSQYALQLGKRSFYEQIGLDIERAYEKTSDELISNILSSDGQEGIEAFTQKRKPNWLSSKNEDKNQ